MMTSQGTILYVEDTADDVFLLEYAFKQAGVVNPLQVVTDGRQATQYLAGEGRFSDRKLYPLPRLVLLDLQLPYVTGLEVLEWIRQQSALECLIVIILSSSAYKGDVRRAYELGANAFLVKPANPDTLADICRSIREFWLTHNLPPEEGMEAIK